MNFIKMIIISISLTGIVAAVGLQALNFPADAVTLATSGAGQGSPQALLVNPAAVGAANSALIRLGWNDWLGSIDGNNLSFLWGQDRHHLLTVRTWDVDNLELRGDIPNDEPDGTFQVQWLSGTYGTAFNLNSWTIGLQGRLNYGKLYEEETNSFTLDMGVQRSLTEQLTAGASLQNLGFANSDSLRQDLPLQMAGGVSWREPWLNSELLLDGVYTEDHDLTMKAALAYSWQGLTFLGGMSRASDYSDISLGMVWQYYRLRVAYGLSLPEADILGTPQYFELGWLL